MSMMVRVLIMWTSIGLSHANSFIYKPWFKSYSHSKTPIGKDLKCANAISRHTFSRYMQGSYFVAIILLCCPRVYQREEDGSASLQHRRSMAKDILWTLRSCLLLWLIILPCLAIPSQHSVVLSRLASCHLSWDCYILWNLIGTIILC